MPNWRLYLLSAYSLLVFSGCAAFSGLLTTGGNSSSNNANTAAAVANAPASVFDELESSSRLYLLGPSALLDNDDRLDAKIIEMQCRYRTPDPPFFVPSVDAQKNWTFIGRLNQGADDREMEAMEYRSWFGFGAPKQQLNSWPVSMATLSEMPMIYLDERLPLVNQSGLSQEQQNDLNQTYLENSGKIRQVVQRLEASYNPDTECASSR